MTQISEGGIGLETRITDIDGVTLMEVIDDERFYDKFDFTDGFVPVASTSHKINVLIASPLTVKCVPKISSIYYFAPGAHTEGDGYLYQDRSLSDTFVFPNGKNNKIDIEWNTYEQFPTLRFYIYETELPEDVYDITIDPGHDASDPGKSICLNGNNIYDPDYYGYCYNGGTLYTESDFNLEISQALKTKLENGEIISKVMEVKNGN